MKRSAVLIPLLAVIVLSTAQANHHSAHHPSVMSIPNDTVKTSIPLWKEGAPGFEDRRDEKELAEDYWVKNVHNPSLTIHLPDPKLANGSAVIILPGGGHRLLVYDAEGTDAAEYLNSLGFTAAVLKYRLFREKGSPYQMQDAKMDGLRAIKVLRSRAKEFGLHEDKIGIMGFSAGGELAAWTAFSDPSDNISSKMIERDQIDRIDGRVNFQILIYPGPLAVPDVLPSSAPPTFLLAANDDACCSEPVLQLANLYRSKQIPLELHLYSQGGHGFNMGQRSTMRSINTWSDRLGDWLLDHIIGIDETK